MIAEEVINKFIRDVINIIIAKPDFMIRAKQKNAPAPFGSFGTVEFVSSSNVGWEQSTLVNRNEDLDINQNIEGSRNMLFSISFYGDGSSDLLRLARSGFIRNSIKELFYIANIGLISRSEIRQISEPLEDTWQERNQMDIVVNVVDLDSDVIKSIQSVIISGAIESAKVKNEFTIEVEK